MPRKNNFIKRLMAEKYDAIEILDRHRSIVPAGKLRNIINNIVEN